ncbi:MAG: helix-turn-helix domain-containing protein [Blautia sp.]|nr:helix-turn-helix domain-containing protein [Blautia sp.]
MFKDLGSRLKSARLNSGLSRKQVAELTGVTVTTIGMYENGERFPSLHMIVKLAAHYRVSVDYLLVCNTGTAGSLSLEGLTDKQVKALKLTTECFRSQNGI